MDTKILFFPSSMTWLLAACSEFQAIPSYEQCSVPTCPDKGTFTILCFLRTFLLQAMRVLGLLGALDPYKYKTLTDETDSKSELGSSQELTTTEQGTTCCHLKLGGVCV